MELQPITPTTLARSREEEECRQLVWPVDDEPREILSVARPRDMPLKIMRRRCARPPSILGDSEHSQIISPVEISLDPCIVGEETPLEEGSFPAAFGKRLLIFKSITDFSGIPDFSTRPLKLDLDAICDDVSYYFRHVLGCIV